MKAARPVRRAGRGNRPARKTGTAPRPDPTEGDSTDIEEAPLDAASRAARKADAFIDLVETALKGADSGHAAGDDRYMVHLVSRDGGASVSLLDGTPVHPADAAMVDCDCSSVAHSVNDSGEPLNLGRKTREWSTAQRRAISVRDKGHCRFPGCQFRHFDIHHMQPWEAGGQTNIANGLCQCRRHHRLLHTGYHVGGDTNGELRFYRPNGTYLGSTFPSADQGLCYPATSRRHPGPSNDLPKRMAHDVDDLIEADGTSEGSCQPVRQ